VQVVDVVHVWGFQEVGTDLVQAHVVRGGL
jgi:hypothetical protein